MGSRAAGLLGTGEVDAHGLDDGRRVRGTGAAAAAHDDRPLAEQRLHQLRDVGRCRGIDEPAAHLETARRRSAARRAGRPALSGRIARTTRSAWAGPSPQFTPRPSTPSCHEATRDLDRRGPEQRAVVAGERGGGDHRELGGDGASRGDRLLDLAEIGLRFDHEEVDTGLGQREGLLVVGLERLLGPYAAVGREAHTQRTHRAAHHLGSRLASSCHAGAVQHVDVTASRRGSRGDIGWRRRCS